MSSSKKHRTARKFQHFKVLRSFGRQIFCRDEAKSAGILCVFRAFLTKYRQKGVAKTILSSTPFCLSKRNPNPSPIGIRSGFLHRGGRGWIRTTEVVDGRFTVCSLWPLGNSSILNCGAGGRTRTPDLLITNQLLYQLSYTSIYRSHSAQLIYHKNICSSRLF